MDINDFLSKYYGGHVSFKDYPDKIENTRLSILLNTYSIKSVDLTGLNLVDSTTIKGIFYNSDLEEIDFGEFDSSNLTNMACTFYYASQLKKINFRDIDTSKVIDMGDMFYNCKSLKEIDLSSFNTQKVKDMSRMFKHCEILTNIDLSNFDTDNVTNMAEMFDFCTNLEKVNIYNFTFKNITQLNSMFEDCISLKEIKLKEFTLPNKQNVNMSSMFRQCNSLINIPILYSNVPESYCTITRIFYKCLRYSIYPSIINLDGSWNNTNILTLLNKLREDFPRLTDVQIYKLLNDIQSTSPDYEYLKFLEQGKNINISFIKNIVEKK